MPCNRNHSKSNWVTIRVLKKDGIGTKKKKFCDEMMGYSMSSKPEVLFCGDIPIGEELPKSYQPLGGEKNGL